MTHSHLLKLVVIVGLAGAVAARAADPVTNAPAAATNTSTDVQAAVAKEMKEAKKKARQAAKEAKAAKTKAEAEAKAAKKKADQEAKQAEKEARKKAKEEAKAAATNPPPAVAEAPAVVAPAVTTTNVAQEPPKKEKKVPWRARLHSLWKEWKKEPPPVVAATNVEVQVRAPAEPAKPAETNLPVAEPSAVVPLEKLAAPALPLSEKMSILWEEGEYRLVVGLDYLLPSDSEVWQNAYAVDVEARRWLGEDFGMSVALGYGMWNVNEDGDPLGGKDEINPATMSGSADTISLGFGGLYRLPLADQYQLILDAGLKYVFVDSSVEIHFDYEGHHSDFNVVSPVYPGDRLAGWIGATLSGSVEDDARVSVLLGVGYQFDLTRESENWLYEDVANDLNALVVRLGVGF